MHGNRTITAIALLCSLFLLTTSPQPSLSQTTQPRPPDSEDAAVNQARAKKIRSVIDLYEFKERKRPETLKDMVPEYFKVLPTTVSGRPFEYDPKTKAVQIPDGEPGGVSFDERKREQLRHAAVRYRIDHKKWPATLAELTPKYLTTIPKTGDGKDFVYDSELGFVHLPVKYGKLTQSDVREIQQMLNRLKRNTDAYYKKHEYKQGPADIADLVEAGLMTQESPPPAGGRYVYNSEDRQWRYTRPAISASEGSPAVKAISYTAEDARRRIQPITPPTSPHAQATLNLSIAKGARKHCQHYRLYEHHFPDSLDDLGATRYFGHVPRTAAGNEFGYDPRIGEVWVPEDEPGGVSKDERIRQQLRRAVIRYRKEHHTWPAKLSDIVPTYYPEIPKTGEGNDYIYDPQRGRIRLPDMPYLKSTEQSTMAYANERIPEKTIQNITRADIHMLSRATSRFQHDKKRLPESVGELLDAGLLAYEPIPLEGGTYVIDPETMRWTPVAVNSQDPVTEAEAQRHIAAIARAFSLFEIHEKKPPQDISDIVEKGYLSAMPPAPKGKAYALKPKSKKEHINLFEKTDNSPITLIDVETPSQPMRLWPELTPRDRLNIHGYRNKFLYVFSMYCQRHNGNLPDTIDDLIPDFIDDLPDLPAGREWLYTKGASPKSSCYLDIKGEPRMRLILRCAG